MKKVKQLGIASLSALLLSHLLYPLLLALKLRMEILLIREHKSNYRLAQSI